jgi:hypothetical protein
MGLHTFHVPHPNPALIRALGWVNDHAILPRVARVQAVHVPAEDEARLRAAARQPFVLCPNHPEFFTDWMVDKWIMDRFAPRAIAWADPEVVNGMGAFGRWFWLSNGLVAAVKGPDLDKALAWSSEQVAAGAGALIHPEGEVNWDNEAPAALRPGAVRIALGAAPRVTGAVHLVPLAWFLRYATDATAGLHRELDYVAARLRIARPEGADPAARLGALFQALLEREAAPWELPLGERTQGFAARLAIGLRAALERLADAWPDLVPAALAGDDRARARAWRQHARRLRSSGRWGSWTAWCASCPLPPTSRASRRNRWGSASSGCASTGCAEPCATTSRASCRAPSHRASSSCAWGRRCPWWRAPTPRRRSRPSMPASTRRSSAPAPTALRAAGRRSPTPTRSTAEPAGATRTGRGPAPRAQRSARSSAAQSRGASSTPRRIHAASTTMPNSTMIASASPVSSPSPSFCTTTQVMAPQIAGPVTAEKRPTMP